MKEDNIKMKTRLCTLIAFAFLLSGCGHETGTNISDSSTITSNTTNIEIDSSTASFNSYIEYFCENANNKEDLDNIAAILEQRVHSGLNTNNYELNVNHSQKMITLEFDYTKDADCFVDISSLQNLIEFKKGESYADEMILNNNHIRSSSAFFDESSGNWSVMIEMEDEGAELLANITKELCNTEVPLSIWIDNELVYAPLVKSPIVDGKIVVTGNFSEQSSNKLAKQISLGFLPYTITIKDYNLGK